MAYTKPSQTLDPKAYESAVYATQVAASSANTGPAVFWQGHLALMAGSRCSKGDTFSQPVYFDMEPGQVRRVKFKAVEDDADW
ncbi:hypothetical protein B7435_24100 [Mycolicibacterium peregrinum]|nr:hypothetical protein B7435_24100 [Mycolicibacterium peregrinum]